jgi:hypothetical protein
MFRLSGWGWVMSAVLMMMTISAYGQKTTGEVNGQVTDTSGALLPHVSVKLTSSSTGLSRTVTSNDQGEYAFQEVPIGTYKIQVQAANFKTFVADQVVVNVSSTARVNAQLQAGGESETVQVVATAIQVQTDSGALGTIVDGTQVKVEWAQLC